MTNKISCQNKKSINEQKILIVLLKTLLIYQVLNFKIERFLLKNFFKKKYKELFSNWKENQLNENITIIYGAGFSGKNITKLSFLTKKVIYFL